MKFIFDIFPIILFFAAFKFKGIYFATAVAMAVTFFQIIAVYIIKRKVEPMLWITLAVISVFGGLTLLLKNEMFIKWKPTVLYWIFSSVILFSQYVSRKNIMKVLLDKQINLPEIAWQKLNLSWGFFFAGLGALNLFVAYSFSTATWVNFKMFGLLGILLIFVIGQSIFLAKYINDKS